MAKIILYTTLFIGGFALISLWNFYSVTHPKEIASGLSPSDINTAAEDVELTASDGITLSGWLIEEGSDQPALILLHGYPTDKGDLLPLAHELKDDFTILLMDARYFGESGGGKSTLGIKEHEDVKAAISFLEERGYESIGLLGYSLGGSTALMAAGEDGRVDALATYGAFSDLRSLSENAFSNLFILKKPMAELVLFWGKIFIGDPLSYTPLDAAKNLDIPVLISHAEDDSFIPVNNAHRLSDALAGNEQAQTQIIEDGAHLGIPDAFVGAAREFFLTHL